MSQPTYPGQENSLPPNPWASYPQGAPQAPQPPTPSEQPVQQLVDQGQVPTESGTPIAEQSVQIPMPQPMQPQMPQPMQNPMTQQMPPQQAVFNANPPYMGGAQSPYAGAPMQQQYPMQPQMPAPKGPGLFDIDFWLPKMKIIAIVVLCLPILVGILTSISTFSTASQLSSLGEFFGGAASGSSGSLVLMGIGTIIGGITTGFLAMLAVLGLGRFLEYTKDLRSKVDAIGKKG